MQGGAFKYKERNLGVLYYMLSSVFFFHGKISLFFDKEIEGGGGKF